MITATIPQCDRHLIANSLLTKLTTDDATSIDIMTPGDIFEVKCLKTNGYSIDNNDGTGVHTFIKLSEVIEFFAKVDIISIDVIVPGTIINDICCNDFISVYTDLRLERNGQSGKDITKIEGNYLNSYSVSGYLMSKIPIVKSQETKETTVIKHGIQELYFILPKTLSQLQTTKDFTPIATAYWLNNVSVSKEIYLKYVASEIDRAAKLLPELSLLISKY